MSVLDNHLIDMEPHLIKACKEQRARIADLEAALTDAMSWTAALARGQGHTSHKVVIESPRYAKLKAVLQNTNVSK